MCDERRQQLMEQYEEAAISLLMEDYAEMEGARLLQEYEAADQNGELSEIPVDLDEKCRKLIDQSFKKKDRILRLRRIRHSVAKVAVIMLVLLGLSTVTVLSVDAFRVPILNFVLGSNGTYTSLTTRENSETEDAQTSIAEKMMSAPIPEEYQLISQKTDSDGSFVLLYQDAEGAFIGFHSRPSDGMMNVDTEDTDVVKMKINNFDALFINKDSFRLIWFDWENEQLYELKANRLDSDSFWELVYVLTEQ